MYEEIVKISYSTRKKQNYLKCVWIKGKNNAIQANSKSETKLVWILYFLPGTSRQSLAFTESNKIFK